MESIKGKEGGEEVRGQETGRRKQKRGAGEKGESDREVEQGGRR